MEISKEYFANKIFFNTDYHASALKFSGAYLHPRDGSYNPYGKKKKYLLLSNETKVKVNLNLN